ncbi:N-terminal acetyltransferase, putative [Plasmodium knowlesi strain H]|uniref:N-terminal acetyltransferase, putative n=3 Tax=Plasmodium knowlesi TaxID=5850 RepID=A0A5K1TX54_PLAKH|nr:N-acetyltransferase, GNAT family, putative [Plasmodium knowlesi strain H]OTN66385.1 putative N-terminal acetyltransferase [Plasmodium knowlesi]CAA9986309.1 N-acetyltransferase, GNAT family, putative [Plasmodium knowlesi strain H]SBO25543.1 N-terminal acetyltransferase, putative [Plasmodium knowlesi strain H]SBO28293.1 N-terminal acetyltransferase, putative [Plasmodium knowlesi strain H]VVS75783.1 N-acetyltransferase, GNAT family, putative [Plasmodium knowlesi strain H]|eukprot:XP_002257714.1 n-terminal acetyltransferase, putative [Plasmodium knowlesi strain H]
MASYQYLSYVDLYKINNINLDPFTEVFNDKFYLRYIYKWPHMNIVTKEMDDHISGYIIGKEEGLGSNYHGHVTALSIEEDSRRTGRGIDLMNEFEKISKAIHVANFVDLFVRITNEPAINMYQKLGYIVNEEIVNYYCGNESALDMRKYLNMGASACVK